MRCISMRSSRFKLIRTLAATAFCANSEKPNGEAQDTKRIAIWGEYIALLLLAGVFFWRGFVPAWKTLNTDFPDYYLAARLYHEGYSLDQIYDWTWTQRQKDHAGIKRPIVAFTLLTPFSLLPALPFSGLPPLQAKHYWLLVNLVFLVAIAGFLYRMSDLNARRIMILIFLAIVPLRTNFLFGQEDILLLLLFTLAAWFYLRNQPARSGAVLAIAASLKIYPGLYFLFFARKKQWRGVISLFAGTLALWVVSAVLFGFQIVKVYLTEVLPWPLRAEGQDPYNINWNSFSALLHRLFIYEPVLNPHPVIHVPSAYAILQTLCQALIFVPCICLIGSSRSDAEHEKLEWGAFAVMLLLLSTNPASYDFAALILTAVFAVGYLIKTGQKRTAVLLMLLYAFVCLPTYRWTPAVMSGWHALLGVPRLWLLTALWVCLLAILSRSYRPALSPHLRWRRAVSFGALGAVLVALGVATNLWSQHDEFRNYKYRLVSRSEALLATYPVVAGSALLFTTMTDRGYGTAELIGGELQILPFPSDSFHPAGVPGANRAWVEVASSRSQIVRFSLDARGRLAGHTVIEAEDAEQPVVSRDLHWLAFVRETKGKGRLWVKALQRDPDGEKMNSRVRPLSPAGFDVLDVAFAPDDRIVFSARHSGPPRLFTILPDSSVIAFQHGIGPRRYPAFSPDGRWLVFSQLERGNWQLRIQNELTHVEHQLTNSNCNSIAPAWYPDSKHLVYASDCARGYGLTALCKIQPVP